MDILYKITATSLLLMCLFAFAASLRYRVHEEIPDSFSVTYGIWFIVNIILFAACFLGAVWI